MILFTIIIKKCNMSLFINNTVIFLSSFFYILQNNQQHDPSESLLSVTVVFCYYSWNSGKACIHFKTFSCKSPQRSDNHLIIEYFYIIAKSRSVLFRNKHKIHVMCHDPPGMQIYSEKLFPTYSHTCVYVAPEIHVFVN